MRVKAILLAAGRGQRLEGQLKPLYVVEGKTMLAHALAFLGALELEEILVVLGHRADEVAPHVRNARPVLNPDYAEGMASSIRAGTRAAEGADAVLILPVDLPELRDPEVGRKVLRAEGLIAAPVHRGRRGHPVRFDRQLFPELLELQGDRGAAELLQRHPVTLVEVDTPAIYRDRDSHRPGEKAGP